MQGFLNGGAKRILSTHSLPKRKLRVSSGGAILFQTRPPVPVLSLLAKLCGLGGNFNMIQLFGCSQEELLLCF